MTENKHTLDHLFALAKQQEPLLPTQNVHEIVNDAPTKAYPGKQLVNFFQNHLNLLIMSTIVSSILIGAVMWMSASKTAISKTVFIPSKIEISKNTGIEKVKPESKKHKSQVLSAKTDSLPKKLSTDKTEIIANKDSSTQQIPQTQTTERMPTIEVDRETHILKLSLSDFQKLGFVFTDSSVSYRNFSRDSVWSAFDFKIYKTTNIKSASKPNFRASVYTDIPINWEAINKGQIQSNSFFPFLSSNSDALMSYYKNTSQFGSRKTLNQNIINHWTISINDTLVPIILDEKSVNNDFSRVIRKMGNKVFWFNPTEDFYKVLPDSLRQSTREFYENTKAIKRKATKEYDLVKYRVFQSAALKNAIVLSKEEWQRLGMSFKQDYVVLAGRMVDTKAIYLISRMKTGSLIDTINAPILSFYPSFITNEDGERPLLWSQIGLRFSSPKKISQDVNRLVPVLLKKNLYPQAKLLTDVYFWFAPTEAFFDSLPPSIGKDIRQEYKALIVRSNPKASSKEKAEVESTTSCHYFTECQNTFNGLSEMKVYPNPASKNINMEIIMEKTTIASIALCDMAGRVLKTIRRNATLNTGVNTYDISLSNYPSGFYVITIYDSFGNVKTQRIIKQ